MLMPPWATEKNTRACSNKRTSGEWLKSVKVRIENMPLVGQAHKLEDLNKKQERIRLGAMIWGSSLKLEKQDDKRKVTTTQLLRYNECNVRGMDVGPARRLGAQGLY